MNKGCIYLFRHLTTPYVKIGMTSTEDVSNRFSSFNTYSPFGGEILAVFKVSDPHKIEKRLHSYFDDKRMNGEFFNLSSEDIDYIKNLFPDKRIEECKLLFDRWLCNPDNNPEMLSELFKTIDFRKTHTSNSEKEIIDSVKLLFSGKLVSLDEILKSIQDTDSSIKKDFLAKTIKKYFTQKHVRMNNSTRRMYIIP